MSPEAWSTVRITMPKIATESPALASATDQLDELGAMLAGRDDVGGVETRDPSCITDGVEFVTVERPELIAYTTPGARAAVEASARALAAALGLDVVVDAEDHEGDDWRDAWKRYYRAMVFRASPGDLELMIRPSWIPRQGGDPERELILDPGRAFGTGLHESTRLCLQILVDLGASAFSTPRRVLDLGCGSGILGLAALRIWPEIAELVLADHDPEAVETARENCEHNAEGIAATLQFRQLSLNDAPPVPALGPASLVLANIRPRVLIPAAPTLRAALGPGGLLVLSGILDEEADAVRAAYPSLELRAKPSQTGWSALVLGAP